LGAVAPLRRALQTDADRLARDLGIGGAVGLGGVIYALVRMAWLLKEPALLTCAREAASLITSERIAVDRRLDVLGGAAGALLGLRVLYDISPDREIWETATACGRHLLEMRKPNEAGHRAWETGAGKRPAGFSHGAAGIAYALLRLSEITGETEFVEAAEEAIAYEADVFSAEAGNWPDLLADDGPTFFVRWCHGAAGIGLARLGGLGVLDTSQIRRDIEVATTTTQRFGLDGIDHLCCGNLGRVEALLEVGRSLSRPDLLTMAMASATQVAARAQQTGSFALHPALPRGMHCPGFFQGTSGIGYELLRLAYPEVLPSVLLWK
jgi:type 2 lantibiotic biosynthesis protein LanM